MVALVKSSRYRWRYLIENGFKSECEFQEISASIDVDNWRKIVQLSALYTTTTPFKKNRCGF